jgi:N6-L-threonylcarbamoyladenine synthase
MFMIAGGVAANSHLRKEVFNVFNDIPVLIPSFEYCTDNAAMISIAGYYQYQQDSTNHGYDLNGDPRLGLIK